MESPDAPQKRLSSRPLALAVVQGGLQLGSGRLQLALELIWAGQRMGVGGERGGGGGGRRPKP